MYMKCKHDGWNYVYIGRAALSGLLDACAMCARARVRLCAADGPMRGQFLFERRFCLVLHMPPLLDGDGPNRYDYIIAGE